MDGDRRRQHATTRSRSPWRTGVDHIVRLGHNQGLARAFAAGLEAAVRAGADVIVNTDADNQYCADDIPKLTAPILAGEADLVIGARPIIGTPHFSRTKKALQLLGSMVVRMASTHHRGGRAERLSRASRARRRSACTCTASTPTRSRPSSPPARQHLAVTSVPIRTNPDLRPVTAGQEPARTTSCARRSRSCAALRPTAAALLRRHRRRGPACVGLCLGVRYLYLVAIGQGDGHIQSVILSALLIGMGVLVGLIGIVADLIAVNRRLLEKVLAHAAGERRRAAAARQPQRRRSRASAA